MTIRDTDRGMQAFLERLASLEQAPRVTVGVHEDVAAEPHDADGTTIGQVAAVTELGDEQEAPVAFVRGAVDARDLGRELALASEAVLLGASVDGELGRIASSLAADMRARAPSATGLLRDSIEARVGGTRVG